MKAQFGPNRSRESGVPMIPMLAHFTHFESPALAAIFAAGVATGVILSYGFARLRIR